MTYVLIGLSVGVLVACMSLYEIDKTSEIDEIEEAQIPIDLITQAQCKSLEEKYAAAMQENEILREDNRVLNARVAQLEYTIHLPPIVVDEN